MHVPVWGEAVLWDILVLSSILSIPGSFGVQQGNEGGSRAEESLSWACCRPSKGHNPDGFGCRQVGLVSRMRLAACKVPIAT